MSDYEYPSLRQRIQAIVDQVKSTLYLPIRVATSNLAIRTYLTSILLFTTSFFLFVLAVTAYVAFYWSYIPRIGFTRELHLQFDHAANLTVDSLPPHPWGVVDLTPEIVSQQLYDITIHLALPRTPENTMEGNFMIDASLLGPKTPALLEQNQPVIAHNRRSAILTYYSKEIDLAKKLLRLPGYLIGFYTETEDIEIQLFEGVEFARGWRNIPSVLKVEIQSRSRKMQIYSCKLSFHARFRGLRWIMYNYRVASAIFFVTSFWMTEMAAMSAAWLALSLFVFPKTEIKTEPRAIKQEEEEEEEEEEEQKLSDTERIFPSYGGAPVMKYQSPDEDRQSKREPDSVDPFPLLIQQAGEAADDEEEEDDFVLDSGLGTSLESSAGGINQTRRRKSGRLRNNS
ncbi:hypothetical protein AAFC00_001544 [Neodothiora populina]|uniref:Seipin n=1 Tax=Neodothiora populina TaxID=2781224 RepID=A0ABR3PP88_9PEZI